MIFSSMKSFKDQSHMEQTYMNYLGGSKLCQRIIEIDKLSIPRRLIGVSDLGLLTRHESPLEDHGSYQPVIEMDLIYSIHDIS